MKKFDFKYLDSGEGYPFIFQHGLGADATQAQTLMSGLENFRTISLDCPGHGNAPLPKNYTPSFDSYTDEVVRLMDTLNIEKAMLGGISMGSGISLNLALRYPDRVRALILVRPAWLDKGKPANLQILLEVAKHVNLANSQSSFEALVGFKEIQTSLPKAASSILGLFSRSQGDATQKVLTSMVMDKPFDNLLDLKNIKQPTLIIVNHHDPLHPHDFGDQIGRFLSDCEITKVFSRYLDDARHRLEVLDRVSSFIKKNL